MQPKVKNQNIVVKTATKLVVIDVATLNKAQKVIRALNHPLRKEMIRVIEAHKELSVEEIQKKLKIEQSVCSQHLAILRNNSALKVRKLGKQRYYSVDAESIRTLQTIIFNLSTFAK